MPNHVTNLLTVSGTEQEKEAFFTAVQNDAFGRGSIDFEKIIPMPLNIYRGDLGPQERERYGKDNWYDWSTEQWHTKWNAYGFDEKQLAQFDGETICFQTAWCAPQPVMETIAQQYPSLTFCHQWADEDLGYNVGEKEYKGGEIISENIPQGGSAAALELADSIHSIDLAEEGFLFDEKTGEYVYEESAELTL